MDRIIVKAGKKYSFLKKNEIKWIESDNGYLKVHIDDNYYVIAMSLHEMENKLNSENFVRISRSKIINILKIKEVVDSEDSNNYTVTLNDSTVLNWARRYRNNFPNLLLFK